MYMRHRLIKIQFVILVYSNVNVHILSDLMDCLAFYGRLQPTALLHFYLLIHVILRLKISVIQTMKIMKIMSLCIAKIFRRLQRKGEIGTDLLRPL